MRLIDADAFDKRIRAAGGMVEEELSEDFKDGILTTLEMLKRQPTIEPERTGHWIHDGSQWKERWICDKCGFKLFGVRTDYCGGCGAHMMEVEHETD